MEIISFEAGFKNFIYIAVLTLFLCNRLEITRGVLSNHFCTSNDNNSVWNIGYIPKLGCFLNIGILLKISQGFPNSILLPEHNDNIFLKWNFQPVFINYWNLYHKGLVDEVLTQHEDGVTCQTFLVVQYHIPCELPEKMLDILLLFESLVPLNVYWKLNTVQVKSALSFVTKQMRG